MVNAIIITLLTWTAAMTTVLVFRKPPATPDETADEQSRERISTKLKDIKEDLQSTV